MVEWKKLGDVANLIRGKVISKDFIRDNGGEYPVYSSQTANEGIFGCIDSYMFDGDYLTWTTDGAYAGTIFRRKGKFNITNVCGLIDITSHDVDQDFLYYWLSLTAKDYVIEGMGNPKLMSNVASTIKTPILPLPEQQRIVGILDTFTSSIENLKEQIAQRRKQYEYYRDQLLDLEGNEGVKLFALNEVCDVINGRAYSQPELLSEGKYRVLRVGNFFSNDSWYYSDLELEDKYYCNKGDLLYAWSASFGPHIWEEEKVIYHYHIWKMNCKEGLQTKYMYYWLQSEDMKKQAFSNLHGATMAHLTKVLMESLKVPVPPLSEQQRIVSVLDTFEASVANLEQQLALREKQYEYYRNKLLTFE